MIDTPKDIKVNPNTVVGSNLSQLVGVTVTDIDVTLEFVYLNPRNPQEGSVVSRITLPKNVAFDLANTINLTIKKHDLKKQGKKDHENN
ncbi:MAG: hypothetical protein NUV87_02405 [Candidatus Roizmanbacteria bacterium]|nr:hypothetical protein [Candidatus Roizmanbacteria bacterium]MCR4312721.1 hypothetical protein [Candidatus Roizmanbacteria bacterium]